MQFILFIKSPWYKKAIVGQRNVSILPPKHAATIFTFSSVFILLRCYHGCSGKAESNDKDGAVPWQQGIEYFTALRRLDKRVWMLNYNGEAHNLVERRNRKDFSVRLSQFFDYYLKDGPLPTWMAEGIPAVKKGRTMGTEPVGEKKSGGK